MLAKTIDITTQTTVKEVVLSLLEDGEEIILTEGDTPIAKVIPFFKPTRSDLAGMFRGAMKMHDDFDAPLPDEFWMGEE